MPKRAKAVTEVLATIAGTPVRVRFAGVTSPEWTAEHRQTVAALAGRIAVEQMGNAEELGARAMESASSLDASRWASASKSLAIVSAILVDKAQLLAGQPTTRAERVDTAELTQRLHRLLGVRDVTASELVSEG